MIKDIFIAYKKNKFASFITIIGLTVFIFCMSIIYSVLKDTLNQTKDINKINNNSINITLNTNKQINYSEANKELFSKLKTETLVIDLGRAIINDLKSSKILGIDFKEKPLLDINIISGRNFNKEDLNSKKAIIGNKLEDCIVLIDGKKYIQIDNEKYEVIGVSGSKEGNSPYDLSIYIPLKQLPENINKTLFDIFQFSIIGDENSKLNTEKVLNSLSIKEKYSIKEPVKQGFFSMFFSNYYFNMDNINTLLLTAIISFFNLIIISSLWINNKKYEIGIKKALGATNKIILKEFFILTLVSSLIASILAIIVQIIFSKIIGDIFFIYLNITFKSILLSTCFSILIALIITICQVKKITKVSIINYMQD